MEYNRNLEGRRRYPRKALSCDIRVYTSVKAGSYSCKLGNISRGGAFLKTPYLPNNGEIITYELIDSGLKVIAVGNAKVVWIKSSGVLSEHGLGISFEEELDESIINKLPKDNRISI